jgi:hypothetical protein
MSNILPFPFQAWKKLYTDALFEDDEEQLAHLISLARSGVVKRSRELFQHDSAECNAERKALDNALHFLELIEASHKNLKTAA